GAHLFEPGDAAIRINDKGYLTSACHSPTLGHDIALGFAVRGPERHGDRMVMVDHLRDLRTEVEVTGPVFLDPQGTRART
ncbi:MAG: glycine cleavage T C-terminal barrel domain-containing protein, partial [Pseudomonadota bacterium]